MPDASNSASLTTVSPSTALIALPFLYFNLALGQVMETAWLLKSHDQTTIGNKVIDRSMTSIVSKLLGFSFGPMFFEFFSERSFLICATLFVSASGVQIFLQFLESEQKVTSIPIKDEISTNELFSSFRKNPFFILSIILCGMLSVSLNPLFVEKILAVGSAFDVSMFWSTAGFAGLLGLSILKKWTYHKKTQIHQAATLFSIISVALIFNIQAPLGIIALAAIYVMFSMIFSTDIQVISANHCPHRQLGFGMAAVHCLLDAGVFIGMVAGAFANHLNGISLSAILAVLLLLRHFCVGKL